MRPAVIAGAACIALGALGIGWFAWDNVGTNLIASPGQKAAVQRFERAPQLAPLNPQPGETYAVLRIPAIHLVEPIIEGTDEADLQHGVGHYSQTVQPGAPGNVGLAGHRTTYGRPFWNLQALKPGDVITIQTAEATYTYKVISQETVSPSDIAVLNSRPVRTLTMTTCTPRFTALQRLAVHALQVY